MKGLATHFAKSLLQIDLGRCRLLAPREYGNTSKDTLRALSLATELGAIEYGGPLSSAERALIDSLHGKVDIPKGLADQIRDEIRSGADPLGSLFLAHASTDKRRQLGAFYTPSALTLPMVDWVLGMNPERIVDVGSGSGRFVNEILRKNSKARIIAVDIDPMATLLTRAVLACMGNTSSRVINSDYTTFNLEPHSGLTAFIGNPPYVRHHLLTRQQKTWAREVATTMGRTISGLAGLHTYFFLATAVMASRGDVGCFVTSSEWLDVNYGSIVRELFLEQLGGESIHVVDPEVMAFRDATTTATISCFRIGRQSKFIRLQPVKRLEDIGKLEDGEPIAKDRLRASPRWSPLIRTRRKAPEGYIELGEICRVHRGAVTGSNAIFVTDGNSYALPVEVLWPSITKARELFAAGTKLETVEGLRRVIALPEDLDVLDSGDKRAVERFLHYAKSKGAADSYIAKNRKAWWSVQVREPAPILATYMARRPPTFVRNLARARHLNIAHGLYPREPLPEYALDNLASYLRTGISVEDGRTYAGGLTKFEPKEMERVLVPSLDVLLEKHL